LDDPLIWLRVIHIGATMMVAGGVLFLAFVAEPALRAAHGTPAAARVRAQSSTMTWISLAVTVLSGAAWLVLQSERVSDASLADLFAQGVIWTVLSETDFGYAWMVRLGLAALLAAILPWLGPSRRSPLLRAAAVVIAAALAGTLAWAGHAAAGSGIEGGVHLTADILHLVAAAAWVGALVPLALLLMAVRIGGDRTLVDVACEAVSRFSTLGAVSVGTLLASGLVNGWMLAGSMPALFGTEYGRLLLLKVALFLVMLSFAAVNRLWLTPALARALGSGPAERALRGIERNTVIEATLAAIVIAIVGLLGTMAPGLQDQAIN
jgi:putative copper resistance protein D